MRKILLALALLLPVTARADFTKLHVDAPLAGLGTVASHLTCSSCTTASNTQTLTNKIISGSSNTFSNIAESSVTNLTPDLASKATDSLVLHLAGTETITGTKTFSAFPDLAGFTMPDGASAGLSASGQAKFIYNNTLKAPQVSVDGGAYQSILTNNWRTVPAGVVLFPATPSAVGTQGYIAALVAGKGATGDSTHPGALGGELDLSSGAGGDAIGSQNPGSGNNIYITTGDGGTGGTGNSSPGTLYLDVGVAHGTGTRRSINVGLTNAGGVSIVGDAASIAPRNALTLTAGAASTWSTSAGLLTISGAGGLTLSAPSSTINIGASTATAINIGNAASPSTTTFAGTLAFPAAGIAMAALNLTYGTTAGTITQGNDSRLPAAPSAAGGVLYDNGSAWARLAAGTNGQVLTSSGAGAPTWTSVGSVPSPSTQGRILYDSGSAWVALGTGTSGQFLQTQGAGANPQWASPAGAGTVTGITFNGGLTAAASNPITASGTASLDLTYAANFTAAHTHTITGIGATAGTAGMTLINTTASTSGAQNQYSPALILQGTAWNSTVSKTVAWAFQTFGTNVATPVPTLNLANNVDGAGWTTQWQIGANTITQAATTSKIQITNAMTYTANTQVSGHILTLASTLSTTSGSYVGSFSDTGATGALYVGMGTGTASVLAYGELLTCSGTCTIGEALCWAGSDGKTVATCAATNNLTTLAGVSATTATNAAVRVARRGRATVNADAGVAVGDIVVTSSSVAGTVKTNNTPSSGGYLGRATSATSSGHITVDIVL